MYFGKYCKYLIKPPNLFMREGQKVKAVLGYLKSDVGTTEKDYIYKQ
jgi:hypothetical protein